MECSTYNCSPWPNTMNDGFDIHPGGKRGSEKGKRWEGIISRYFSSLFKLLWKIDELLAQLHPALNLRWIWSGVCPKETDPHFKKRRTALLWKTKTHWALCLCAGKMNWFPVPRAGLSRRDRKKVTLSVNEKQKSCGLPWCFCGTSSPLLRWIGWKGFVITKQKFNPQALFSFSIRLCLSACLFLSSLLVHFLHTQQNWQTVRASQLSTSEPPCPLKSCEGSPHLSSSCLPSGITLWENSGSSALLSAQLLCPCRSEEKWPRKSRKG